MISIQFMNTVYSLGLVSLARFLCQAVSQSFTALLILLNDGFISGQFSGIEHIHSYYCTTITSMHF